MQYHKVYAQNSRELMERYQIGSLLAKVLDYYQWDENQISEFLSTPKPFVSSGHPIAQAIIQRILLAKERKQKVFVFGDYDTDGICATTMMVQWLRSLQIETGYYIPNRLLEGYGLNVERTRQAIEKGYQLIITVDNGVKAQEALTYAKERGIDCIVCDHHTIEESVDCFALWHPSLLDPSCQYLCGAGCVLELIKESQMDVSDYLGLAMVATIGDMMVLKGENRWIVQQGLNDLREGKYPALSALFSQPIQTITVDDIAFQIVPKLNSVGRLADQANVNQVVAFLLSQDPLEIQRTAQQITDLNQKRKQMVKQQAEYVDPKALESSFLIIKDDRFHPGIVGLLANQYCRQYQKPVMVLAGKEDQYVGSIRSIEGLNIMECLFPIRHLLTAYGGHAQAAGLTFAKKHNQEIEQYLQQYPYEYHEPVVDCLVVDEEDITNENIRELYQYGPYGQGVTLPLFCYCQPKIQNYQYMKKKTYLKWNLQGLEAIWFSDSSCYEDFLETCNLDFIGKISSNFFRGQWKYVLQLEHVENSHVQQEKICYNKNVKMEA